MLGHVEAVDVSSPYYFDVSYQESHTEDGRPQGEEKDGNKVPFQTPALES